MQNHHVLIFVSTLAPEMPADVVAEITKQARWNNERDDITGLLVFDGENFAQLMEGPQEAVLRAVGKMMTDSRHVDMEVIFSAPTSTGRRFPSWRLGYLLLDLQEFGPHSLRGLKGAVAMDSFNFMLPALDIAVGEAVPTSLVRRRV